ncbi:MAG: gluconokinase [Pseudomonadota bacterium]
MTVEKFILMGVAGCGKTSVGEALHAKLGWQYVDGDHLHQPHSIAKMERGEPLTDEDRAPWLARVGRELRDVEGTIAVGCSALKRGYRDIIRDTACTDVCFIHLAGTRELIEKRMRARSGHFMPLSLLDSQFATLETPADDEMAVTVNINAELAAIVSEIENAVQSLS